MKKSTATAVATFVLLAVATVALASEGGETASSAALLKDFLYRCFNFAIMFGLLAYFLAKPLRKVLAGRREGIEKPLRDAEAAKAEAEARFAEYDSKLTKAEQEIEGIYAAIKREGELERERILANAQEMAKTITQEARKAADNEVAKARVELRREATRMAIEIAEELLTKNITGDDQKRMVNEYMQKVGELH
ncbi:MAG TPA: F0F1 ATP synthase subunit B [Desulfuromonadales bacterium]|nr:F0F1 ATP synthase subunit B [Desulfuromonadales bacterium]